VATWSRRLSAAQAKQPGTVRRADAPLPDGLPEGIRPEDLTALRAVGALAREHPELRARVEVRRHGVGGDEEELQVEVRHLDGRVSYDVVGAATTATDAAVAAAPAAPADADDADTAGGAHVGDDAEDDGLISGDRIAEVLSDALVLTSDIVAIFASVGAEALWANDAFATTIPIRAGDKVWLVELIDEWSKAQYEVNVLPALVQFGRWRGRLVFQPDAADPPIPVVASVVAHRDAAGEIEAVTMVAADLRPLVEAEAQLRAGRSPLAALVEHPADLVFVVDAEATIRYASPATTRLLGQADDALDGSSLLDWVHPDDHTGLGDLAALARPDEDGIAKVVELRLEAEDGTWRIIEAVGTDLLENPVIAGVVFNARDITDRVESEQRLADRAYTDPLTLLPNRMRLLDRLSGALASSPPRSVVVVLVDVDRFSAVVEGHGRDVADALLRQIGHRLVDATRPSDLVARLTGNTFALVMQGVTDLDGALAAAERVRQTLSEPYRSGEDDADGQELTIAVSLGLAVSHQDQSAEDLVSDAGAAVGIAKDNGGNRLEVLTGKVRSSAQRRRDVEGLLRRALTESDGVQVHYQPIFDLASGKVVAAEALLRVHDDEGALLSPASFLEAAEDTGLIAPLGRQVLEATCRQLARWNEAGEDDTPRQVSVNVSPRQLTDPAFPGVVGEAIEAAGIEPGQVGLEITESTMSGDRGTVDESVAALRAMGVSIGLDDFGTGQSSLGYLKRFPLDFVKIDRELIGGLGRDESDMAIVRATVDLAHSLGLQVVAVGVETAEQREILELLGVDRAQGFHYSPAVPAADVAERVRGLDDV
jgi:diguanylate cyclase (GGDEF)-like protein/PAS domain S-box-containing protein